ncbi:RIO1 family-domain-containing protein [Globomyces pollinis-pini]|nr:RIO1 family-domain-containing protein [Globomyces pollinis-pini]
MILFKLINRGVIYEVNGCISTGKEANVYHALTPENDHLAIKIYKTSILVFKDRDRYVSGEYRFRHGYSKSNPRKMVQTWAEKEMRNLKRLQACGIPCPDPVVLRLHVLVMTLIGDKAGWAAPRLKDAVIRKEETFQKIYRQLCKILWVLYNRCKLVHADFSEYNLLYQKGVIYVIDVSQSVEHDHPHALEFLRKDVSNVIDYLRKKLTGQIMTVRELFDFVVTDYSIIEPKVKEFPGFEETMTEDQILDMYLDNVHKEIDERPTNYLENSTIQSNEQVFKNVYIPRTLEEIIDHEADIEKARKGIENDLVYESVTGLSLQDAIKPTENGDGRQPSELSSDQEVDEDGSDHSDSESSDEDKFSKTSNLKKHEDKESKKERKQLVKEQKKAKRQTKMPKSLKKRKTKSKK